MKKLSAALVLVVAAFALGACSAQGPGQPCAKPCGPQGAVEKAPAAAAAIYWCACGPECKCTTVAKQPGKCRCGKELAGGHVVFTEGDTALVCTCGPCCSCAIDPKDHGKCGCGQPVKRIDLKGTGLYFCNCGGSCGCNAVSDKPGSCKCGMPLHQAP